MHLPTPSGLNDEATVLCLPTESRLKGKYSIRFGQNDGPMPRVPAHQLAPSYCHGRDLESAMINRRQRFVDSPRPSRCETLSARNRFAGQPKFGRGLPGGARGGPEPTSAGLLAIVGLFLLRRARRLTREWSADDTVWSS